MAIKVKAQPARESGEPGAEQCKAKGISRPKSKEFSEPELEATETAVKCHSKSIDFDQTTETGIIDQSKTRAPVSRLITNLWKTKTRGIQRIGSKTATDPEIEAPRIKPDSRLKSKDLALEIETPHAEIIDRSKLGWHSPSYSMSRSIELDPEILHANRCIAFNGETATIDSYKVIRAQILQRMKQSGANTLMVTSVLPGEGKTTTAINLAFIMAKEFQQTVLLVDCDLQRQDIHKKLGYPSDKGLINYLLDDCPVTELFTWPGVEKITLISGGRTIRDSSELLGSPRMKELVSDMKSRYPNRFVIFDMQSTFAGADTLVFAPLVDNILVVVQEGNASTKEINRAVSLLPEDKLLGLMLNRHKAASHIVTASSSRRNDRGVENGKVIQN